MPAEATPAEAAPAEPTAEAMPAEPTAEGKANKPRKTKLEREIEKVRKAAKVLRKEISDEEAMQQALRNLEELEKSPQLKTSKTLVVYYDSPPDWGEEFIYSKFGEKETKEKVAARRRRDFLSPCIAYGVEYSSPEYGKIVEALGYIPVAKNKLHARDMGFLFLEVMKAKYAS